jgi:DNA replication protein DnaC
LGQADRDVPAATAILDRSLHHPNVIAISGKSYRLKHQTIQQKA